MISGIRLKVARLKTERDDMNDNNSIPPVSLAVTTFNEEARLAKCLASARGLVREIVVVDSGSTDGTVAIAEAEGSRVISQDWLGHSAQKQVALDACTQSWVLVLDADEEVSPELRQSILTFFKSGDVDWFHGCRFNRKIRFLGRWISHGDWYPDTKLRLVQRDKARMGGNAAHDEVLVSGAVKHLHGDLLHDSYPTIQSYLNKIGPFADDFAERLEKEGKKWSLAANLLRPFWRFLRAYFLRLGFLDGFPGFWIAYATAFSVFVRYSRQYEVEASKFGKE
jgi:glycosyltransferase involved in cell wall biosynthesis